MSFCMGVGCYNQSDKNKDIFFHTLYQKTIKCGKLGLQLLEEQNSPRVAGFARNTLHRIPTKIPADWSLNCARHNTLRERLVLYLELCQVTGYFLDLSKLVRYIYIEINFRADLLHTHPEIYHAGLFSSTIIVTVLCMQLYRVFLLILNEKYNFRCEFIFGFIARIIGVNVRARGRFFAKLRMHLSTRNFISIRYLNNLKSRKFHALSKISYILFWIFFFFLDPCPLHCFCYVACDFVIPSKNCIVAVIFFELGTDATNTWRYDPSYMMTKSIM